METLARAAGILSVVAFACFFANVLAGALLRTAYLSDMGEMLLLVAASASFVVLVLARERLAAGSGPDLHGPGKTGGT